MTRDRSVGQKRFARALAAAFALLLAALLTHHLGGRGETVTTVAQVLNALGTATAVVAMVLRWKGPWREPE